MSETATRAHYIGVREMYALNHACREIWEAFGEVPYLVGSALTRPDYRDVDVRLILPDDEFDRLFPVPEASPFWSLLCATLGKRLYDATGLDIDFQIQRQTDANAAHTGMRSALGITLNYAAGLGGNG